MINKPFPQNLVISYILQISEIKLL